MTLRILLLVALVMGAVSSRGADRKTLELVWLDHHGLFPDAAKVQLEAEDLLRDLGVSARWEVGTDPRPPRAGAVRISIVLLPSEPSSFRLLPSAMGVVLLPDRRPQSSVFLFYRPILRNLGLGRDSGAMLRPRETKLVARALGRVVVHEVIHAVAPRLSHADEGLMHDELLASQLSKSKISVDEGTTRAFLKGLEGLEGLERPATKSAAGSGRPE